MVKRFHKLVSILTYEVSWVVLWHHSEANIAEEVHYFMNMPKVGSLQKNENILQKHKTLVI